MELQWQKAGRTNESLRAQSTQSTRGKERSGNGPSGMRFQGAARGLAAGHVYSCPYKAKLVGPGEARILQNERSSRQGETKSSVKVQPAMAASRSRNWA